MTNANFSEWIRRDAICVIAAITLSRARPGGTGLEQSDAVVVVVGELPYAESKGDRTDLRLPASDIALIKKAKQNGAPVVTVLLSGRPLILGAALDASDAFVAAWLPGTEGLGVTDVLFGDFQPTGKLPRVWPRSVATDSTTTGISSQYPFGFGLTFGELPASSRVKTASAQR
jgi:beta-glucosidase